MWREGERERVSARTRAQDGAGERGWVPELIGVGLGLDGLHVCYLAPQLLCCRLRFRFKFEGGRLRFKVYEV